MPTMSVSGDQGVSVAALRLLSSRHKWGSEFIAAKTFKSWSQRQQR